MASARDSSLESLLPWTPIELEKIAFTLEKHHAFDIRIYEPSFLAKSVEKHRISTGLPDKASYIDLLSSSNEERHNLHASLTVGFSEFFRAPLTFAVLAESIFPRLAEAMVKSNRHQLRIWSAGCAAGQEAWSLAMLLDHLGNERSVPIPFQIFATDNSDEQLAKARRGVYDMETVRNVPLGFIRKYFTTKNNTFTISPSLKNRVDFSFYDLLDVNTSTPAAGIYGDFDLVLCNNVLFYYNRNARKRIVGKLCDALRPDGYLVTGEAEREMMQDCAFLASQPVISTIFHKHGTTAGGTI